MAIKRIKGGFHITSDTDPLTGQPWEPGEGPNRTPAATVAQAIIDKATEQFTPKAFDLTESQRSIIQNALRVAADKYDENVKTLKSDGSFPRIAAQFRQQAADARALDNRLEFAEYVKFGPEVSE